MYDILVIDDDEMMVEIISAFLVDGGYSVRSARDGQQGLDEIARQVPDLIVLDMNMPVMDGYVVAARVRQDPRTANTPIIAATADSAEEGSRAALAGGWSAFVSKPIDADELIARIGSLLPTRALGA